MSDEKSLKWIECDGGPHLILEKRLVESWKADSCESHYGKACEIDDYIGLISVADGYGIVISEDVARSTWISAEDHKGGYLAVWDYAEEGISDNFIADKIREAGEELFESTGIECPIQSSELYLFAACDTETDWIYGFLEFQIEPGIYAVDIIEKFSFHNCCFRIFKFRKK
ncbi:MAG: hypothetical protein KAZ87_11750 [Spirochaetes bacterium]|nr:hypothetical protein [Spirochaetota bacterium]